MRSIIKLTRRFVGILCLSTLFLLALNIILFLMIASTQLGGIGPFTTAENLLAGLQRTENGCTISEEAAQMLEKEDAWALFIDDTTRQVVWHTDNLPSGIPLQYTLSDISDITRGYLEDYPTFTSGSGEGLAVVGFPKDRYWKHMSPAWDYNLIKNSPFLLLAVIGANMTAIFLIYLIANTKLLKSVNPIARGIQTLPEGAPVYVPEQGLLSDLAKDINQTSELLQSQRIDLRKKETARANWISGVSHDIRTPLSMVMGYSGQLETDPGLSEENQKKASIIRQQSLKMKNLIDDLNLASKLEYHMQPLHPAPVNLVAVIRQCAADFINADLAQKHPLVWEIPDGLGPCIIAGDKHLLSRAVGNLLTNAQAHNPDGCHIRLSVSARDAVYSVTIEDDGIGMSDEQLERLQNTPHYMMNDDSSSEPRHGLGLLIVQQIINAHHGKTEFSTVRPHGFCVTLSLPAGSRSNL